MQELDYIKDVLKQIKPTIQANYHVNEIGLLGSVLRDDFEKDSDIDKVVNFNLSIGIEFVDLADFIEKKLKRKVDLVSKNGIKEKYFKTFSNEIYYV